MGLLADFRAEMRAGFSSLVTPVGPLASLISPAEASILNFVEEVAGIHRILIG